jgi:hypothetical protein
MTKEGVVWVGMSFREELQGRYSISPESIACGMIFDWAPTTEKGQKPACLFHLHAAKPAV